MRILAIDPSSTSTGYAVMDSPEQLLDAGKLHSDSKVKINRILVMAAEVEGLIREYRPERAVVEITSGKVARKRHRGRGAGLGMYGMGVGVIFERTRAVMNGAVDPVIENDWTAGSSKRSRQVTVEVMFPGYERKADRGMDVSDAIALGLWWFNQKQVTGLNEPKG